MKRKIYNNIIEVISYALLTGSTWFFSYAAINEGVNNKNTFDIIENKFIIALAMIFVSSYFYYKSNPIEVVKEICKCLLISVSMNLFSIYYFKDLVGEEKILPVFGVIVGQVLLQLGSLIFISYFTNSTRLHGKTYAICEYMSLGILFIVAYFVKMKIVVILFIVFLLIIFLVVGKKFYYNYEQISIKNRNIKAVEENKVIEKEKMYIEAFSRYIPKNGRILQAGFEKECDYHLLLNLGFRVDVLDSSSEKCDYIKNLFKGKAINESFSQIKLNNKYEGIWAIHYLNHVRSNDLKTTFQKLYSALSDNGVMLLGIKLGKKDGIYEGEYYKEYTPKQLKKLLSLSDSDVCKNNVIDGTLYLIWPKNKNMTINKVQNKI